MSKESASKIRAPRSGMPSRRPRKVAPDGKKTGKVTALVIEAPIQKQVVGDEPGESKQIAESHPFKELVDSAQVIAPPFDLFVLSTMSETNTELGPCIDTMEKNIDGFGARVIPVVNVKAKDAPENSKKAVAEEFTMLRNFFMYAGMEESFRALRMNTRKDIEGTGNGYWEVIRGALGDIQFFELMRSYQVRLSPKEEKPYQFKMPIHELQADGSVKIEKIGRRKRFRRYAQVSTAIRSSSISTGYKTRWFKEFGDPRVYDNKTGQLVPEEKLKDFPEEQRANEVVHFKIYAPRSPYGLPRYIGVLLDMFGDRKASEINYITFCNNNVPSMVVAVSNGELTQDSVDRITEFLEQVQGDDNRSKVLVLEAEPVGEEGEQSGQMKIEVKPMTSEQIHDAMFQKYSSANQEKVRVSFRLPPIFLGRSTDYTRATADTSRRLADEQVFAPERDEFDDWINRILFPEMGVIYHRFQSNSPNTTDNTELVKILSSAEKTGGMTPRRADKILQDILGQDLPALVEDEKFNLDQPFSLSMAEAVKNQADANEPGQQITALKRLQRLGELVGGKDATGVDVVKALLVLRSQLEQAWEEEAELDDDDHDHAPDHGDKE